MIRNWKSKLIAGFSFTSMMFIFQACYGTPQDIQNDVLVEGQVKSKTSGLPIKEIRVSPAGSTQYQRTDDAGKFSFYTPSDGSLKLLFEDTDADMNGAFQTKDTTLTNVYNKVWVDIKLEDR
jgi:hypothetical protein